ncbi:hypothetical protein J437_LFUL014499 [Ladona fulva]|uniref:CABIT domain-containing protein n=1 Tax=Ladona fulva TaxID=123851 RepID=A0A8K0KQV7_LADFU|nr:hypothetical protein J437_LFUL014499 [Ladona fulva]
MAISTMESPIPISHHYELPRISWSPERLCPRRFLDKYSVPRIVHVSPDDATVPLCHALDLSRPILLYQHYNCARVVAKSIRKRQRHWEESGPPIAIPEEYGGWFTLIAEDGRQMATCFTSIAHVVSARLHFFLTAFDLPAYKLISVPGGISGEKGKSIYSKATVQSGQVLRLMGVFEDTKEQLNGARRSDVRLSSFLQRLSQGSNGRFRGAVPLQGARFPTSSSKYAQCLTQANEVVFVPVKNPGRFYVAHPPSSPWTKAKMNSLPSSLSSSLSTPLSMDTKRAFTLSQFLRFGPLPIRVHLICGPLPIALPSNGFTGTLLLEEWHQEDVVLACSLPDDSSSNCSLLEMELDSRLLFSRPLRHEARIGRSPPVRAALAFCCDHAHQWRSNMKVTHHVFQEKGITRKGEPKKEEEPPYSRVWDEVTAEENIYAEICEVQVKGGQYYYVRGGSDGTFSGTSSSPEDEFCYDSVC